MKILLIAALLLIFLSLTVIANVPTTQESILTCNGSAEPVLIPETDDVTWTTVGTASTIFGRSGGGIIDNYMYSFGSDGINCAQAFNLSTELWETSTSAPFGMDNWASVG